MTKLHMYMHPTNSMGRPVEKNVLTWPWPWLWTQPSTLAEWACPAELRAASYYFHFRLILHENSASSRSWRKIRRDCTLIYHFCHVSGLCAKTTKQPDGKLSKIHTQSQTDRQTDTETETRIQTHTQTHIYTHTHTHMHTHTHTHTHTQTYTHTHTHAHTHVRYLLVWYWLSFEKEPQW